MLLTGGVPKFNVTLILGSSLTLLSIWFCLKKEVPSIVPLEKLQDLSSDGYASEALLR